MLLKLIEVIYYERTNGYYRLANPTNFLQTYKLPPINAIETILHGGLRILLEKIKNVQVLYQCERDGKKTFTTNFLQLSFARIYNKYILQ